MGKHQGVQSSHWTLTTTPVQNPEWTLSLQDKSFTWEGISGNASRGVQRRDRNRSLEAEPKAQCGCMSFMGGREGEFSSEGSREEGKGG